MKTLKLIISLILLFIALWLISSLPYQGSDWDFHFRPAALHLRNPYVIPGNFSPPWLYFLLFPIALLPPAISKGVLCLLTIVIVYRYVGREKTLWVFTSLPAIVVIWYGQVDALVLLGFIIPHEFSLLFLAIKPQDAFLTSLNRLNVKSVIIFGLGVIISICIYGLWPLYALEMVNSHHNLSLFPWSVPVGIMILILIWKHYIPSSDAVLCLASLCFAPYFYHQNLLPLISCLIRETDSRWIWLSITLASWFLIFL